LKSYSSRESIKTVLYSRRSNQSNKFGNGFDHSERPMKDVSGFFVGRADLKSEALIGKKEVKRSHRNIPFSPSLRGRRSL